MESYPCYTFISGALNENPLFCHLLLNSFLFLQLPDHILDEVAPNSDIPRTVKTLDDFSVDPLCDKEAYFQDLKVNLP